MTITNLLKTALRQPVQKAGETLAAYFQQAEAHSDRLVQDAYAQILDYFLLSPQDPIARAGLEIARRIDDPNDPDHFGAHRNGYHNQKHMFEVTVSAALLLALHEHAKNPQIFSAFEKLCYLTAPVIHDIGHDGTNNGKGADRKPMRLEAHAMALATPVIRHAFGGDYKAAERALAEMDALISSTDVGGGPASPAAFFAQWGRFHRGERIDRPVTPAKELERFALLLARSPLIAERSCMLQDADLMAATSLTKEWAKLQDLRLAKEDASRLAFDGDIDWNGVVWFHQNLAEYKSRTGLYFTENFQQIQANALTMRARQNAPVPA